MTMRERRGEKVTAAAAVAAAAGVLCVLVVVLSGGTRGDGVALLDAAKVGKGSSYYSYENDPWRAQDGGSYKLWAQNYRSKHGDGKLYGTGYGDHGLASEEEEPSKENKKNGWQRVEFNKWLKKQGGAPDEFWLEHGFASKGAEFSLAMQRLGIKDQDDLNAFNPRADLFRSPGCQFEHGATLYTSSGHAYCGWLPVWAEGGGGEGEGRKGVKLEYAERKGRVTGEETKQRLNRVKAAVKNMVPTLTGKIRYDDPQFYCYSKYQEGPEIAACLRAIKQNSDPVTGRRVDKGPTWKEATKGLWDTHANGDPSVGGSSLMDSTWQQLTSDLWDTKPYKEVNGLQY